jgi:hypothetical protein
MKPRIQRWTVHSCALHNWHIISSKLPHREPNWESRVLLTIDAYSRSEKMHEDSTRASETCLIGLCTGLFAATAIASSPSLSGLVPIAAQMVLMAFRTGAYVAALADRLHKNSEGSSSWTYVLPGISEVAASSIINDFHRGNVSTPTLLRDNQLTPSSESHSRVTHISVQLLQTVLQLVDHQRH